MVRVALAALVGADLGHAGQGAQGQAGGGSGSFAIDRQGGQRPAQCFQQGAGLRLEAQVRFHLPAVRLIQGVEQIADQVLIHRFILQITRAIDSTTLAT